jgi:Leucine-rich repeat (LRR) protein
LDFNAIASLEQTFEFPGAECLIILDLNENSMMTIDSGVFSNLNRLRWLDLGMNSISSLSVGSFDGLESLAVLFLYGNYLTRIEAEIFENLT